MLAKQNHLPSFEKFENGKSVSSEYFRILIKPNTLTYNRFGFVISKKIDKRAVARNRMRRLLIEAVKEHIKEAGGKDLLFIVRKNFTSIPTKEIFQITQELLRKVLNNETM